MKPYPSEELDRMSKREIIRLYKRTVEQFNDAEPVVHGEWIEVDVGDCCYRCSECGFIRDAYLLDTSNYCPKCGAKMDE